MTTEYKIVINWNELQHLLLSARKYGVSTVFTNGCFDLLHAGHVDYLEQAGQLGSVLVVGVNSDRSVQRLKGKTRPIQSQADRCRILAALRCVDYVTVFDTDTPMELIQKLRPDIIVKGDDWSLGEVVGAEFVKGYGGMVQLVPLVHSVKTSALIGRILSRRSATDVAAQA